MSQEGNLTVFNLRDFRFQKKMSNMSNDLNTSFDASPEKIAPVRTRIITILDSDSDCEINGENSNSNTSNVTNTKVDTNVTNTNGNFSGSSSKKSDSVIEKENQVKYLIKAFNGIHSFEVYEVLSSVDFQIEPAMQKLTKKYGPHTFSDYDTWKKEYIGNKDSNEIKPTLKRKEEDSDLQNKYGKDEYAVV